MRPKKGRLTGKSEKYKRIFYKKPKFGIRFAQPTVASDRFPDFNSGFKFGECFRISNTQRD